jgi:hypothetical protein
MREAQLNDLFSVGIDELTHRVCEAQTLWGCRELYYQFELTKENSRRRCQRSLAINKNKVDARR